MSAVIATVLLAGLCAGLMLARAEGLGSEHGEPVMAPDAGTEALCLLDLALDTSRGRLRHPTRGVFLGSKLLDPVCQVVPTMPTLPSPYGGRLSYLPSHVVTPCEIRTETSCHTVRTAHGIPSPEVSRDEWACEITPDLNISWADGRGLSLAEAETPDPMQTWNMVEDPGRPATPDEWAWLMARMGGLPGHKAPTEAALLAARERHVERLSRSGYRVLR